MNYREVATGILYHTIRCMKETSMGIDMCVFDPELAALHLSYINKN